MTRQSQGLQLNLNAIRDQMGRLGFEPPHFYVFARYARYSEVPIFRIESTVTQMSLPPHTPPPGWYPDQSGQLRWWDGQAWGEPAAPQPQPTAMATPAAHTPLQTRIKPAFSKLSAAAMALVVLAWVFWLTDTLTPPPIAERCETQECWNAVADGTLNLTPPPTPAMILGYFVAPMLLTAVGLGLAGLIRSTSRPLGVLGIALPVLTIALMLLPKLLMLLGFTLWGLFAGASQLT